jgi:intracellular sulfur oxidation DsrE/DsrF family protein
MQRQELSDGDIVDGVAVVPAGAVEVTQLWHNGHVYLRP